MSDQKKIHDFAPRTLGAGFVHKRDLVLAIILVAFGAFMYYEASKFPEAPAILGDERSGCARHRLSQRQSVDERRMRVWG